MGFLLRRVGLYFSAFLVAITLNFVLPRTMPGDPIDAIFANSMGKMQPETLQAYREMLGFVDAPMWEQYLAYVKSVFTLDFGPSILLFPTPVVDVLAAKLPWTLGLAGAATVLTITIGLLLGVYAAYNRGSIVDTYMPPLFTAIGAMPQAVTALFLFFGLAVTYKWFPLSYGANPDIEPLWTFEYIKSVLYHATLPLFVMVIGGIAMWIFNMRNAMINVLGEDYITMARAKGLSPNRVMTRYAARNALLPVVTSVAMAVAFVVSGAVFIETVFNYPGVGLLLIKAVGVRDYPTLQACFLLIVVCVLIANFIADLTYYLLDPRLRK